jgi:hypothetical protein
MHYPTNSRILPPGLPSKAAEFKQEALARPKVSVDQCGEDSSDCGANHLPMINAQHRDQKEDMQISAGCKEMSRLRLQRTEATKKDSTISPALSKRQSNRTKASQGDWLNNQMEKRLANSEHIQKFAKVQATTSDFAANDRLTGHKSSHIGNPNFHLAQLRKDEGIEEQSSDFDKSDEEEKEMDTEEFSTNPNGPTSQNGDEKDFAKKDFPMLDRSNTDQRAAIASAKLGVLPKRVVMSRFAVSKQMVESPESSKILSPVEFKQRVATQTQDQFNVILGDCKKVWLQEYKQNYMNDPTLNAPDLPIQCLSKQASDHIWEAKQKTGMEGSNKQIYKLLTDDQLTYLHSYEDVLMDEFRLLEPKQQCKPSIEQRHPQIKEVMRAKLFDWVLHCTKVTHIEDKNVFFTACQYIDAYYAKVQQEMPKKDLQLTAIACIFMASKLLDTICLKMSFCRDVLGHKKFSSQQILEKESEVI